MMSAPFICVDCKKLLKTAATSCAHCGSLNVRLAAPDEYEITGYAPTLIISGPDPITGHDRFKVDAPGSSSEARISDSGEVFLKVEGTEGIGRTGEPRLMKTLKERWTADGRSVSVLEGTDDRGEDAQVVIDGVNYVVQAVTVPTAPDFWREANQSSAATEVSLPHAIAWLETAITKKANVTPVDQRDRTILAIDAQHSGVLSNATVTEAYLREYGDPHMAHGFASVWVVGPTRNHCSQIGGPAP